MYGSWAKLFSVLMAPSGQWGDNNQAFRHR